MLMSKGDYLERAMLGTSRGILAITHLIFYKKISLLSQRLFS